MNVLARYIDMNSIENKDTVKNPYPTSIKIVKTLIVDTQMMS